MQLVRQLTGRSLVGNAGTYLAANLINAAIPLLLLPILTRYLEPSEYGEVAIFQVWVALVGTICGLNVYGAANRKFFDYTQWSDELAEFIFSCLVILLLSSLCVLAVAVLISGWLAEILGLAKTWIVIGVVFATAGFLVQLRLGQYQVRNQARSFGALQVFRAVLDMAMSICLVVVFVLGVSGRLTASTFAAVAAGIIAILLLCRDGLVRWTWRPDLMREAVAFGLPLVPHMIGGFLLFVADRAIVKAQLGIEAAGYYMVAVQLSMGMHLVLESINRAYVPWLFRILARDIEAEKKAVVRLTYFYTIFLAIAVALVFLVGDDLLVLIAGERYRPSAQLLAWLVLAQAIRGMYYMVTNYIFYAKKTAVIAKITISVGLLNVVLLYVLTGEFGLVGATWAMCLSMVVYWLATWWAANRVYPMPWVQGLLETVARNSD